MMREKSSAILSGALLLVAILAAYSNHFHDGFHMDDGHAIVNNAAIREPRNIPLFFRDATTFSALPSNQSYRPLVSTLLAMTTDSPTGCSRFGFIFQSLRSSSRSRCCSYLSFIICSRAMRPHHPAAGLRSPAPRATRFTPQTLTPSTTSSSQRR